MNSFFQFFSYVALVLPELRLCKGCEDDVGEHRVSKRFLN